MNTFINNASGAVTVRYSGVDHVNSCARVKSQNFDGPTKFIISFTYVIVYMLGNLLTIRDEPCFFRGDGTDPLYSSTFFDR